MFFVVYSRPKLRKENPGVPAKDILKMASERWETLTANEKDLWSKEATNANN